MIRDRAKQRSFSANDSVKKIAADRKGAPISGPSDRFLWSSQLDGSSTSFRSTITACGSGSIREP
jgi:hypothetical protein